MINAWPFNLPFKFSGAESLSITFHVNPSTALPPASLNSPVEPTVTPSGIAAVYNTPPVAGSTIEIGPVNDTASSG